MHKEEKSENKAVLSELDNIRESIFRPLLLAYAILGFIAFIPSVIIAVIESLWLIAAVDILGYLLVLYLVINSSLKIDIRIIAILLLSFVIGVVLLVVVGPFGAGYFWLFAVPILAAILLRFWYGIAALVLNVILLSVFGVLQYYNLLDWNKMYSFPLENWLILSVNFILLNAGVTLPIAVLIERLEKSLFKEKEFARDLSIERKELIKAKADAEKADKLKSEFLAQMSHEIRTPINTIMSFLSLIKEEFPMEKKETIVDESFKMIELGSMRITRTIDSILNMSELQTGSFRSKFEMVNVYDDVIIPVAREFKQYASNKFLELNVQEVSRPYYCDCDRYTVTQIFVNLIENAIKYTNEGSIDIAIKPSGDDRFSVSISDTGIGIADDFLERLFDPFSQEEQGYTRRYEGTGLGLSLVKKYVEINNLNISVESKKDKGSTFSVGFTNPPSD